VVGIVSRHAPDTLFDPEAADDIDFGIAVWD
jgi:hypothetical protein